MATVLTPCMQPVCGFRLRARNFNFFSSHLPICRVWEGVSAPRRAFVFAQQAFLWCTMPHGARRARCHAATSASQHLVAASELIAAPRLLAGRGKHVLVTTQQWMASGRSGHAAAPGGADNQREARRTDAPPATLCLRVMHAELLLWEKSFTSSRPWMSRHRAGRCLLRASSSWLSPSTASTCTSRRWISACYPTTAPRNTEPAAGRLAAVSSCAEESAVFSSCWWYFDNRCAWFAGALARRGARCR